MVLTGDVVLRSNVRKGGVLRCCGLAGHEAIPLKSSQDALATVTNENGIPLDGPAIFRVS